MSVRGAVCAVVLLVGCASTPSEVPAHWDGVHEGTVSRGGLLSVGEGRTAGVWTRRVVSPAFDRLLVSLNPDGRLPPGSRVATHVRVRVGARWTRWLPVGTYGGDPGLPRSEVSQPSLGVKVETDLVTCAKPAQAAELRLTLSGGVRVARVFVDTWTRSATPPPRGVRSPAWGREVAGVPRRSQAIEDPAIASRVCSPTSLGMVLGRWGERATTAAVASAVYDHGAKIYGNWSFNVAHAGTLGLDARAVHLRGWTEVEREIAAGRPVVVSHRFKKGELPGSPITATDGHLLVIVGFTDEGDVIVHDPAANPNRDQAVRRVYRRDGLARAIWVNAEGVGYLVRRP